jgi:hypothetical protein
MRAFACADPVFHAACSLNGACVGAALSEFKTIYLIAPAGGKPRKYGFATQAALDAYFTRMGAAGLVASGTEAVLLRLEELEEGTTYSLEFGDGSPIYKLKENAKAVGAHIDHQATAWEQQVIHRVK